MEQSTLPKLSHPKFSVEIPSTGVTVQIRPFLVKEEKIALVAAQTDSMSTKMESMVQILQNCVVEAPEGFNVDNLTMFDFEYLFLKLRGVSVNNVIELAYTPDKNNEDKKFNLRINIDDVRVQHLNKEGSYEAYDPKSDAYTKSGKQIALEGKLGMVVRYPSVGVIRKYLTVGDVPSEIDYDLLYACTTKVYDDKNVYADFSREEFEEFFENLPAKSLANLKSFFDNTPKIRHLVIYTDKATGEKHEILLEGLDSFFD